MSISDYANIYSHTHSIVEQREVTNATTVIEDGVRITYHATVLAGVHVHEQGMVGAMASELSEHVLKSDRDSIKALIGLTG